MTAPVRLALFGRVLAVTLASLTLAALIVFAR